MLLLKEEEQERLAGPTTYESLMLWCDSYIQKLLGKRRMQDAFWGCAGQSKVVLCTDYSGKGCAEMAFDIITQSLINSGHLSMEQGESWMTWRASDVDELCRQVLLSFDSQMSPCHVFGDILHRMPQDLHASLECLLEEHMDEAMEAHGLKPLKKKQRREGSSVSNHGDVKVECASSAGAKDWGEKFMEAAQPLLQQSTSWATEQWCYKCGSNCPLRPPVEGDAPMIRIAVAGYCCQPWSQMGKQQRWLSPMSLVWLAWVGDLLDWKPEVVVGECTQWFDFPMLQQYLGHVYVVSECTYSPRDLGIPVARRRQYCLGVRKDLVIVEPFNDETLQRHFTRELLIDGSVFFHAPRSRVESEKKKLASKRQHIVCSELDSIDWPELLMGSFRVRLTVTQRKQKLRGCPSCWWT